MRKCPAFRGKDHLLARGLALRTLARKALTNAPPEGIVRLFPHNRHVKPQTGLRLGAILLIELSPFDSVKDVGVGLLVF